MSIFGLNNPIDRHTIELYETGKSKQLPPAIWKRALRKLEYLDLATGLEDLKVPPSNRLHEAGEGPERAILHFCERPMEDLFSVCRWRRI